VQRLSYRGAVRVNFLKGVPSEKSLEHINLGLEQVSKAVLVTLRERNSGRGIRKSFMSAECNTEREGSSGCISGRLRGASYGCIHNNTRHAKRDFGGFEGVTRKISPEQTWLMGELSRPERDALSGTEFADESRNIPSIVKPYPFLDSHSTQSAERLITVDSSTNQYIQPLQKRVCPDQ